METAGGIRTGFYAMGRRYARRGWSAIPLGHMSWLWGMMVRYPRTVVATTFALTVLLGRDAMHLRIESSVESMLPPDDPGVAYYQETRRLFGGDDVGVVGIRAEDVFATGTLEKIDVVTRALAKLEGVERVLSITNMVDVAADVFTPPKLLSRIPPNPEDVAALREKLAAVPIYSQNLIAPDGRGAAINVFFERMSQAEYETLDLDGQIERLIATHAGPEHFFYTSAGHVTQAATVLMRRDLYRFTPIALGLIVLTFWASFRTKRGVLLPLASVGAALVWTLGIVVLTGKSITLGTFILPPLLLVVGSAYAIHVMARYYEESERGGERADVARRAVERVWVPLAISALTTAIGFGSLMVNRIPAIWELGLFAVIGVLALMVSNLTILPACLALMPVERAARRARDGQPALEGLLGRVADWVSRKRRWILLGGVTVGAVALAGVFRIQADSDFLEYLSPSSQVRLDNQVINQRIVGSNPFYVVIEAPKAGALERWENLKLIERLQAFINTLPGVTSSISIVDYLELLESGLNKGTGGDLVVEDEGNLVPVEPPKPFWDEPKNLKPVLELVKTSPETFEGVVTRDFSKTSIMVRTQLSGSAAVDATLEWIRSYVAQRVPAELRVELTGNLVLLNNTTTDLIDGQVRSLGLALLVIFVVMSLMFLSVRIGFLAILPNVLPILAFFGILGWGGIDLNLGTSLIAAIALGLAIDSTIHYMARLNGELRGETDQAAAIERTLRAVGAPVLYTTTALLLGFLTFSLSSFIPIQTFGIMSSVTLLIALVANLGLLPALLATTKIITLWDLLGVRLGEEPTKTIPLFAGLRPSQARVVALMGEVRQYDPGEYVVRQGDVGEEMYVIIEGDVEVWASGNGARRHIRNLTRGDVVGEMGLVRHIQRSADVVAATPVEVLAVDEKFLTRIERRYPRIAARVFLNLTRILSDRLESTTGAFVAVQRA
jgi:predicted RND superfamily exporter protein